MNAHFTSSSVILVISSSSRKLGERLTNIIRSLQPSTIDAIEQINKKRRENRGEGKQRNVLCAFTFTFTFKKKAVTKDGWSSYVTHWRISDMQLNAQQKQVKSETALKWSNDLHFHIVVVMTVDYVGGQSETE
jgi:hypothetical protein